MSHPTRILGHEDGHHRKLSSPMLFTGSSASQSPVPEKPLPATFPDLNREKYMTQLHSCADASLPSSSARKMKTEWAKIWSRSELETQTPSHPYLMETTGELESGWKDVHELAYSFPEDDNRLPACSNGVPGDGRGCGATTSFELQDGKAPVPKVDERFPANEDSWTISKEEYDALSISEPGTNHFGLLDAEWFGGKPKFLENFQPISLSTFHGSPVDGTASFASSTSSPMPRSPHGSPSDGNASLASNTAPPMTPFFLGSSTRESISFQSMPLFFHENSYEEASFANSSSLPMPPFLHDSSNYGGSSFPSSASSFHSSSRKPVNDIGLVEPPTKKARMMTESSSSTTGPSSGVFEEDEKLRRRRLRFGASITTNPTSPPEGVTNVSLDEIVSKRNISYTRTTLYTDQNRWRKDYPKKPLTGGRRLASGKWVGAHHDNQVEKCGWKRNAA